MKLRQLLEEGATFTEAEQQFIDIQRGILVVGYDRWRDEQKSNKTQSRGAASS